MIEKKVMSGLVLGLIFIFVLSVMFIPASAQTVSSTEYGNGWQKICYSDGKCSYSNHETYLRWDNQWIPAEWLNISNGNWSYTVNDTGTEIQFGADNRTISIPKANTKFNLQLFKISPSLTYSKTVLVNRMINVPTQVIFDNVTYVPNTLGYLVFPYSLSQIKDFADEHNIRLGRWRFQAGKEHIDIHDDVVVNHTIFNEMGQNETYQAVTTLDKQYYAFKIINDEIRVYFVKSEANKLNGNITFALNSWTVGNGGNAWTSNSSYSNFMLDRNTNHIILPNSVIDGLVLSHKMSGSSGITSYDMNLTSDNNGTLTNMNVGLDNGSSGWNSSGKFGNALIFDGVNDYVDAGNAASLNFSGNITVSTWIYQKTTNTNNGDMYVTKINRDVDESWQLYSYNNIPTFLIMNNASTRVVAQYGTINNNIWTYITGIYNGSSVSIYANGVFLGSTSVTSMHLSSEPVRIGARYQASSLQTTTIFDGLIDNVQVYNRALTNNEINQTMNNTMLTVANLTTWYNAGTGNETYQIDVNATTQTNSNYTAFYRQNGTATWTAIGTANSTGNQSISLSTRYQNTDVKIELYGNGTATHGTATPDLISTTFWTQTATSGNAVNFTFSNKTISETQIYQSSQSTRISVDVNDSDGYITGVTVGITFAGVELNYSMTGGNDTWIYDFKTGVTGTYTVSGFYVTDNGTGTNSSAWDQVFYVVPVSAGGGGGAPAIVPTGTAKPLSIEGAEQKPPMTMMEDLLGSWVALPNQTKWTVVILILLGLYWESGRNDKKRRR